MTLPLVSSLTYSEGLQLMESARLLQQEKIFFFEHPDTITLGKSTKAEDLLLPEEQLTCQGYHLARVERGGRATYHGPGQLVCYPVIRLKDSTQIRSFVSKLAQLLIDYLKTLSIEAHYPQASPGLWVGEAKLAAFGLSVQRGFTGHGFALNISCDLSRYRVIVPCGLHAPVTSIKKLLGEAPSLEEVAASLVEPLSKLLGSPAAP
jgi:lipoate-protein ligase B